LAKHDASQTDVQVAYRQLRCTKRSKSDSKMYHQQRVLSSSIRNQARTHANTCTPHITQSEHRARQRLSPAQKESTSAFGTRLIAKSFPHYRNSKMAERRRRVIHIANGMLRQIHHCCHGNATIDPSLLLASNKGLFDTKLCYLGDLLRRNWNCLEAIGARLVRNV